MMELTNAEYWYELGLKGTAVKDIESTKDDPNSWVYESNRLAFCKGIKERELIQLLEGEEKCQII